MIQQSCFHSCHHPDISYLSHCLCISVYIVQQFLIFDSFLSHASHLPLCIFVYSPMIKLCICYSQPFTHTHIQQSVLMTAHSWHSSLTYHPLISKDAFISPIRTIQVLQSDSSWYILSPPRTSPPYFLYLPLVHA